ncbi:hypothetical protein Bca4012_049264 [Brassica carinata]
MSLPLEDENKIISRMDYKGKRNVIDLYAGVRKSIKVSKSAWHIYLWFNVVESLHSQKHYSKEDEDKEAMKTSTRPF